jgi:hypothetical protein
MKKAVLLAWLFAIAPRLPLMAQQPAPDLAALQQQIAAMEQHNKDLEDRVFSLEGQVRILKSQQASATPAQAAPAAGANPTAETAQESVAAATPPGLGSAGMGAPQTALFGGASASAKALNPDISVIGDFIGKAGGNSVQPNPSFQMHESEVGFQAIIDPYARGDFFISFGEEGVNLEEGYITFTSLPAGFLVKAGKMRSVFGKVNLMHNHVMPWVERPLVTDNLVGGEDGIDDAGVSVSHIIPAPKGLFLEATGQVFRGDSGNPDQPVFKAWTNSDVSTVAHLRIYKDITESTNLDVGGSYARGYNDAGPNFISNLYGFDATVHWKPLRRAIYHSFIGRTELIWNQRQQQNGLQRGFGYYISGDYQLGRRWVVGGRFDWSNRTQDANLTDKGGSAILTYAPSEFSLIRGQYRYTNYAGNINANELFMQVLFSLGAHGAHPF